MEKEDILRRTNGGLDVFRHYIPGNWRVGKNFLNPFYKDTKASMHVYYDRHNGIYRMKDFGDGRYSGDCFTLVGLLNGWSCTHAQDFVCIMAKIAHDLNLQVDTCPMTATATGCKTLENTATAPAIKNENAKPGIEALPEKPFDEKELTYWAAYGITPQILARYGVSSLTGLKTANKVIMRTESEPIFLYRFGREGTTQKVYLPSSANRFLYLHKGRDEWFGYAQLPARASRVVLTGGEKDVLTLSALGIPAFCLNSETAGLPESLMESLSERFGSILFLYDMDETGCRCSRELCNKYAERYAVGQVSLPLNGSKQEKDISDLTRLRISAGHTSAQISAEINALLDQAGRSDYQRLMNRYADCFIDCTRPPAEPKTLLRIHQETAASAGDLVCITGGSGTGKSNFADCILSGALNTLQSPIDTLGMQILPNTEQKALLLFDTEQSEYQSYRNMTRILNRARLPLQPEYMKMINLCRVGRKERQSFIEQYMKLASRTYQGIHCVIIDGLADLISSANDEEESVRLIEWLHGLARKYETVIVSVVHTAGVPEKVRGHLGSELTRKSSAVIDIEADRKRGCSVVKILKLRAGNLHRAGISAFGWDEQTAMHRSVAI